MSPSQNNHSLAIKISPPSLQVGVSNLPISASFVLKIEGLNEKLLMESYVYVFTATGSEKKKYINKSEHTRINF